MDSYGSIEHAKVSARNLAVEALEEFRTAYSNAPPSRQKRLARDIVLYMVERDCARLARQPVLLCRFVFGASLLFVTDERAT
jgi:hypothetical protein